METRPPLPPFTLETAAQKVRAAEDGWNTRDPQRVSMAYTAQSRWRNRAEFITGREEIVGLLSRKWARELDYRLIKELWAFGGNRIAVRFAYEWHDTAAPGSAPMATSNGSSPKTAAWRAARPRSTTSRSTRPTACSAGRSAPDRWTIPA